MLRTFSVILAVTCLSSASMSTASRAQSPETLPSLVPDRPTAGMSSSIVPEGYFQVESGFTFLREEIDVGRLTRVQSLATSARFGVLRWLELQANYAGVFDDTIDLDVGNEVNPPLPDHRTNNGDLDVAAKLALHEAARWRAAALVGLTFPTGDDWVGTASVDPRGTLAGSLSLTSRISVDVNAGIDGFTDEITVLSAGGGAPTTKKDRRFDALTTTALGVALSPRWSVAIEHAMSVDSEGNSESAHTWLAAATWTAIPRMAIDAWFGTGLSDEAPDRFGGFGMSLRLPN